MTTPRLKKLLKLSGEIINLYLETEENSDSGYNVNPYVEENNDVPVRDTEVVSITFPRWQLEWEFLEPLAKRLSTTDIEWNITREEKNFVLNIF